MTNKTIGKYGEEIAKNFLIKNGFKILEQNYRYSKIAEIDIIALKNKVVHFVEVKTRTQDVFRKPLEAITKTKLKQIYTCAMFYISNSKGKYKKYQLDGIGIELDKDTVKNIEFIENISYS